MPTYVQYQSIYVFGDWSSPNEKATTIREVPDRDPANPAGIAGDKMRAALYEGSYDNIRFTYFEADGIDTSKSKRHPEAINPRDYSPTYVIADSVITAAEFRKERVAHGEWKKEWLSREPHARPTHSVLSDYNLAARILRFAKDTRYIAVRRSLDGMNRFEDGKHYSSIKLGEVVVSPDFKVIYQAPQNMVSAVLQRSAANKP